MKREGAGGRNNHALKKDMLNHAPKLISATLEWISLTS